VHAYRGGPHNIAWTHPEEVNAALLTFLAKLGMSDPFLSSDEVLCRDLGKARPDIRTDCDILHHVVR
jgi:hypothetical protein